MTSGYFATACFALAVLHTFLVKQFQERAHRYPSGSALENAFHLLGEVEVVFGLWAAVFLVGLSFTASKVEAVNYLETRNFTEPLFVFVIMAMCSTRPLLLWAEKLILACTKLFPLSSVKSLYAATLIFGPLTGSLITEPAAMTITAYLLLKNFYARGISERFKYATLGLLFVNVSIGGTLLPHAAPPVLMVAAKWGWDTNFMLMHFGWKAVIAVITSTFFVIALFNKEFSILQSESPAREEPQSIPLWVGLSHMCLLVLVIWNSHHTSVFVGVFLFFLGLVRVTQEYQSEVKLKEALLVAFFLGGLVVLGGPQDWWLQPLLSRLSPILLYWGATGLTAITDNAALTYLGSQVEGLTDIAKYALVAGSVVGGGLTVIANAPNPAGYGILNSAFGENGIQPLRLFLWALIPTFIALVSFFPY